VSASARCSPASTRRWWPGSGSTTWTGCWPTRGIVSNRAKIEATINNARLYGELAEEFGSLADYVWQYEPDPQSRPPLLNHATLLQLGQSPESKAMSKDLRRRGWSFVSPTTVYAFMQAMGLVNDHLKGCDRRPPVERERQRFWRPAIAAAGCAFTRTPVAHHAVERTRSGEAGGLEPATKRL
jgi:hypothetical protein